MPNQTLISIDRTLQETPSFTAPTDNFNLTIVNPFGTTIFFVINPTKPAVDTFKLIRIPPFTDRSITLKLGEKVWPAAPHEFGPVQILLVHDEVA